MTFSYKNTDIFFTAKGTGNPIVFLHGFLESSKIWEPFVEELSKKRQVILIDLPGHGKSGVIEEVHSMELMADAVKEVLIHLEVEQATIVGHSMGGYVSLAFCEKFPSMTRCLLLLNSTPSEDSKERKVNRQRAITVVKKNKKAFVSMAISNLLTPENNKKFKEQISALKAEAIKFPSKGITAALKGMKIRTNRIQALNEFEGPKYVVLGKNDPILDYELTAKAVKQANCKVIFNENGHLSFIENFSQIKEIVHFIE